MLLHRIVLALIFALLLPFGTSELLSVPELNLTGPKKETKSYSKTSDGLLLGVNGGVCQFDWNYYKAYSKFTPVTYKKDVSGQGYFASLSVIKNSNHLSPLYLILQIGYKSAKPYLHQDVWDVEYQKKYLNQELPDKKPLNYRLECQIDIVNFDLLFSLMDLGSFGVNFGPSFNYILKNSYKEYAFIREEIDDRFFKENSEFSGMEDNNRKAIFIEGDRLNQKDIAVCLNGSLFYFLNIYKKVYANFNIGLDFGLTSLVDFEMNRIFNIKAGIQIVYDFGK